MGKLVLPHAFTLHFPDEIWVSIYKFIGHSYFLFCKVLFMTFVHFSIGLFLSFFLIHYEFFMYSI